MPQADNVTVATYADDTDLFANSDCPTEASNLIQNNLDIIAIWLKKWNICVNDEKSNHITFALRNGDCPPIFINVEQIPNSNRVKYLGMDLDRLLTWKDRSLTNLAKKNALNDSI